MICRAVSSYTSTIKVLSCAREGKLEFANQKSPKILLVTMPETPLYPPLPRVNEEVRCIVSAVTEDTMTTKLEMPST